MIEWGWGNWFLLEATADAALVDSPEEDEEEDDDGLVDCTATRKHPCAGECDRRTGLPPGAGGSGSVLFTCAHG